MKKEVERVQIQPFLSESYPEKVYSATVIGLILIALTSIVGIVTMSICAPNGPFEGLVALSSAAVGGLVGVFSRSRSPG